MGKWTVDGRRRAVLRWCLGLCLVVSACGQSSPKSPPIIVGKPDGAADVVCTKETDCRGNEACIGAICQVDPCRAATLDCQLGMGCLARCAPVENRCKNVDCGKGKTCVEGECVEGCYEPDPCATLPCVEGEVCEVRNGVALCIPFTECDAECAEGTKCITECAPPPKEVMPDPCVGVTCEAGNVCSGGDCVPNACAGIKCEGAEICVNGECFDTCCGDTCGGEGDVCVLANCRHPLCTGSCPDPATIACGTPGPCNQPCVGVCDPDLECAADGLGGLACICGPKCAGKACGEPDGCGGICGGCPHVDDICVGDDETAECCSPFCELNGECGVSDGCAFTCHGTCPQNYSCLDFGGQQFQCACTPGCSGVACGTADGCGGQCFGTCAAPNTECVATSVVDYGCECAPQCSGKACGADDGCGGMCNGTCPGGMACGEDYQCHAQLCAPACGCGQICVGVSCMPLCGPDTTLCNCNDCCDSSEKCSVGGCVPK